MKAAVLGGGSWGTALGAQLVRAGHETRLWLRDAALCRTLNAEHTNTSYLPEVRLPTDLHATTELAWAVEGCEAVLLVVPSQFVGELCGRLAALLAPETLVVSAAKGLEVDSLRRMSEVVGERLPGRPRAVLSGPSFALEVARGLPTAVVVASNDHETAERLQRAVSTRSFRAYASDDVVGVELAGALKNVIAIAAGILDGLGLGANTQAALITRGLAEVTRLAVAEGGRSDTLAGLAGLGDLVLTCTGALSRNRRLGQALGRGLDLEHARAQTVQVAEGVRTTLAACALARRARVELPIAEQMRAVLYDGKAPGAAIDDLMSRRLKRE